MAMGMGAGKGSVAEINVTPLIDVLLVLLIIFMVIVPVLPKGIESAVAKPSDAPSEASLPPVMLEVHGGAAEGADGGAEALAYRVDGRAVEAGALGRELRARLAVRQQRALMVDADRG